MTDTPADDLVERLRIRSNQWSAGNLTDTDAALDSQAASEIARLRQKLEEAERDIEAFKHALAQEKRNTESAHYDYEEARAWAETRVGEEVGKAMDAEEALTLAQSQRDALAKAAYEKCAQIAEAEPELPGDMPNAVLANFFADPAETMRACVRVTKANIAREIRALASARAQAVGE